jgi:hypothetical protein
MQGIRSQAGQTGAKLVAGALDSQADRAHQAQQSSLDREHQALTTAATLNTQSKIAKAKPKK